MNNSDMPANPVKGCDNALLNLKDGLIDSDYLKQGQFSIGLTKREAFAMAAMQGYTVSMSISTVDCEDIAKMSTLMADALLKELEEK